jgi:adenylate cyclase
MAEEEFERTLSAILSADVEGYSRLMGEDEDATIRTLTTYRELMSTIIQKHRGRVVDSPGDNLLAEFGSVADAVRCAVEIQEEFRVRNAELPENRKMEFRIGINLGDVVKEGERIYGDGVNITARVEGLSEGGGICISGTVYDSIKNKLSLSYESLGEHTVKNITEPIRVYRMRVGPDAAAPGVSKEKRHGVKLLPFTNMSDDPKQEYFSDGITENIITALSKTPKLFVIARNSTFTYKDKPVKVQQVAEELGVRYILEGSVQKTEKRVRINAQLIDAITGRHLWAERYDRNLSDIFAVQDEITIKIISALRVKLTKGESLWGVGTDNLDAYLKYLQSRKHGQRFSKESYALRRKLAEEAIALDPEYVDAYLELSDTYLHSMRSSSPESAKQLLEQAEELVKKAISLRADHADARAFLGRIYLRKKQFDEAIAELQRAVAMAPNSADVNARLAYTLENAGRPEESISLYEKAMRLSPVSDSWYVAGLGWSYFGMGHYEEAISALKRYLNHDPENKMVRASLAAAYIMLGREEEARNEAAEVLRLDPKFSVEAYRKRSQYKNPEDVKRFYDALLKAGLPE